MYRLTIAILSLIALTLAGCAHEAVAPQVQAPEAQGTGDQAIADRTVPNQPAEEDRAAASQPTGDQGPPRIKPDQDPRYALPPAGQRSLTIFLGSQTFEYVEDDRVVASGKVSTGTREHPTPAGSFRVLSKDENKRSGKYTNYFDENTPMPYSLQFSGPYFVHEGWVPGHADSHGCVRLHYENARLLYSRMKIGDRIQVKQQGAARPSNPWGELLPLVF
jgi:lipoprotein-anchoring transpeptidase ErfK/SrfK